MKRISILLLVMLFLTQASWAQNQEEKKKSTPFWEYRSGISIERFQDLKSSATTLTGAVLPIGIYRGWVSDNSISTLGLDLRLGTVKSPLNSVTEVSSAVANLHYGYLKKIDKPIPFFNKWYLGGRADLRVQQLNNETLGNSATNNIYSAGFSVVNHFERPIKVFKKDVTLSYTLSVALLSYAKEDNSFAFAAPQEALENGDFDTQNFENGLFKYGEIATINEFNNIRSRIAIHFPAKRRSSWALAYDWQLVKYTKVKQYGATSAAHSFSIAYHLPKKKK